MNCFLEIYFLCDCVCVWVGVGCVHITQCLWRSEEGTGFRTDGVREVVSYLTQELRNKCHPLHKHYPLLNSKSYLSSPVTYSERNIFILQTDFENTHGKIIKLLQCMLLPSHRELVFQFIKDIHNAFP